MTKRRAIVRTSGLGIVFAAGYLCGVLTQPPAAEAQMGDLMKRRGRPPARAVGRSEAR